MAILAYKKLPFKFDPEQLKADLHVIPKDAWHSHFNSLHYKWGWSAVPLVSAKGSASDAEIGWGNDFAPTPILASCPYFQDVLAQFKCSLLRVRLLRLESGANIKEHVDRIDKDSSWTRIHIPIITHEDVLFIVNGERVQMLPGESWYLETALPHKLENNSPVYRVHLVVDCKINDFINDLYGFELQPYREKRMGVYRRVQVKFQIIDFVRRFFHRIRMVSYLALTDRKKLCELFKSKFYK